MTHQVRYWQRSRKGGSKQPPNTKYCGRPGKWGNRYLPGRRLINGKVVSCSVEQTVELYRTNLQQSITINDFCELTAYDYLSCWCREGEPCHVQDVLIPRVNTLLKEAA